MTPVVVSVAPTETVVVAAGVLPINPVVVLQVTNLDGTQTFNGTIYSRTGTEALAASSVADLTGIGPGVSRLVQVDARGLSAIELRGSMSGAGGNVRVAAT